MGEVPMRIPGVRHKLTSDHLSMMRIPERFLKAEVSTIPNENLRLAVQTYVDQLDQHLDDGRGMLFWGDNGTGKTGAACAIGKEARRLGASVLFITARGYFDASFDKTIFDENDGQTVIDRASRVDLLLFDDLGKEPLGKKETGWVERLFEGLFRSRSSNKQTTIITANLAIKAVSGQGGTAGASFPERYTHTMIDVLKEVMIPYHVIGENLREASSRRAVESFNDAMMNGDKRRSVG